MSRNMPRGEGRNGMDRALGVRSIVPAPPDTWALYHEDGGPGIEDRVYFFGTWYDAEAGLFVAGPLSGMGLYLDPCVEAENFVGYRIGKERFERASSLGPSANWPE